MKKDLSPTEQAILKAAEQEFMAKGLAGARTNTIAQKAGVTHAMLHYYFRTKEQLFEKVVDNKLVLFTESFDYLLNKTDPKNVSIDIQDWVATFVSKHFDFVTANPELVMFVVNELQSNPEKMDYWFQEAGKIVAKLGAAVQSRLDSAASKGEICSINFPTFVSDMIALNAMSVAMVGIGSRMLGMTEGEYLIFRKKENIMLMQKRLIP